MSIYFNESNKNFYLDGKNITYSFCVNRANYLTHTYFGKKISHEFNLGYFYPGGGNSFMATIPGKNYGYGEMPPEITFFGTSDYREPTVEFENKIGDRCIELLYVGHEILENKPQMKTMPSMNGGETLVVHLLDNINSFGADLYYTVYDDCDVIARRIVYKNLSNEKIKLNRAYSFVLSLPENDYQVLSLHGSWANERFEQMTPVQYGVVEIDSKRTSSSAFLNPFVAFVKNDTNEENGEAIGINLVYSSSFVLKTQGTTTGDTIVLGGINDFDFCWNLEAGEEFETPEVVISYSAEGLGGMSRAFHDAYRNYLINPNFVKKSRPILINNWEATYFNFTEEKLKNIIDAVVGTGIDTFVLDDGWFGVRNDATSGLGDWFVNTDKLPNGLKSVIDYAHSKGLKFGLWFEPEMVSPNSDLFRAHPDWAIGAPNREHSLSRNQCILDITRSEVRDYIVETINTFIRENEIDYVKWDSNRNVTESYSFGRNAENQKEFAHRYAIGLYDLLERIVNANPNVMFEGCSGGGARFDGAVLHYFPQIWTSDNSDAESRTIIQYGTSFVYPLSTMSCHVSECPNHQTGRNSSYATRANIAHLGATGYELDTTKWNDDDRKEVVREIEQYKEMEDLVLNGDLYRIDDPNKSNYFSFNIVSKDKKKAVLTCYRRLCGANVMYKIVKVKGLDPNKKYFVRELNLTLTGDVLINKGIATNFASQQDFQGIVFHIDEV